MSQNRADAHGDGNPLFRSHPLCKEVGRYEALGHVEQSYRNRIPPTQHPVHVGRAEVLAAVFAQVDSRTVLGGQVTGGNRANQIRQADYQRKLQCRSRLRRSFKRIGVPMKPHSL